LKDQLVEKDLELKYLKDELKDWWHDDLKNSKNVQFKENLVNNDQSNETLGVSPDKIGEQKMKNLKQRTSTKNSTGSFTIKSSTAYPAGKKGLVPQGLEHNKFKDLQIGSVQYNNSLKILEKLEGIEKNKKKLEPLNIGKGDETSKKDDEKRPSSVRQKNSKNNEKFKLRFSTTLDQGSLKPNTR